jgi:predicted DNA-binding protein YlxM (UPF0122 family)
MQQDAPLSISRAVTRKPNPTTGKPPKRPAAALTKRVRTAIDAQVFDGLSRAEAAKAAGLSESAVYQALRKPAVLAYWNEQLKVLREGERARNLQRLGEIRDQNENYGAAVRAIQVLEGHGDSQRPGVSVSINVVPGYVMAPPDRPQVIDNEGHLIRNQMVIDAKPLIDNDDVGG